MKYGRYNEMCKLNNQSFYDKIWKIRGCGNGARGSVALTNDNKIIFVRDTRAFL